MIDSTSKRQKEIIESAGKLMMEKGVKGLTTKNLAVEMGFSESALYRHFKSKEDIIVLLLDYLANNIKERIDEIVKKENTSIEKLILIFNSQFEFFSKNPHFVIAILSEGLFNESEKINQSILKIIDYKMTILSALINEGKQNNEIESVIETPEIVHVLMGSFRLMMLKWKIFNFQMDLITQGNKIMNTNINLFKI